MNSHEDVNRLEQEAARFRNANPKVYALFCEIALESTRLRPTFGVAAIWERMRWEIEISTDEDFINPYTGEKLKLNNNHRAYFARWFMQDFDKPGFFRTRRVIQQETENA